MTTTYVETFWVGSLHSFSHHIDITFILIASCKAWDQKSGRINRIIWRLLTKVFIAQWGWSRNQPTILLANTILESFWAPNYIYTANLLWNTPHQNHHHPYFTNWKGMTIYCIKLSRSKGCKIFSLIQYTTADCRMQKNRHWAREVLNFSISKVFCVLYG